MYLKLQQYLIKILFRFKLLKKLGNISTFSPTLAKTSLSEWASFLSSASKVMILLHFVLLPNNGSFFFETLHGHFY